MTARATLGAQVRGNSVSGATDLGSFVDSLLSAAVYDDRRALFGQRDSSRASHKRGLAFQS